MTGGAQRVADRLGGGHRLGVVAVHADAVHRRQALAVHASAAAASRACAARGARMRRCRAARRRAGCAAPACRRRYRRGRRRPRRPPAGRRAARPRPAATAPAPAGSARGRRRARRGPRSRASAASTQAMLFSAPCGLTWVTGAPSARAIAGQGADLVDQHAPPVRPAATSMGRRPKPCRSGNAGCAPRLTPCCLRRAPPCRRITSGSPAWKPQATLAELTTPAARRRCPWARRRSFRRGRR